MRAPPVFLLDTDHLGILQDRVQPECQRLLDRISRFPATALYVLIVSIHEQVIVCDPLVSGGPRGSVPRPTAHSPR